MNRILVRNSCIIVRNYELGESQQLERNFQIWNPTCHRYDILGMYYDKESKLLFLPRGIDIGYLKRCLNEKYHDVDSPNDFDHIEGIMMKYGPRNDDQKQALRFMCGVNEYEENAYLPQLSVNLNTGVG